LYRFQTEQVRRTLAIAPRMRTSVGSSL
jgi:hypothetical protein